MPAYYGSFGMRLHMKAPGMRLHFIGDNFQKQAGQSILSLCENSDRIIRSITAEGYSHIAARSQRCLRRTQL